VTASRPADLHEWVSFDDPDEQRTWVFDLTYLLSNYTCIYGCGCQGIREVRAPERAEGCCTFGAHFVDADDVANVRRRTRRLTPEQWQHHALGQRKKPLVKGDPDDDGARPTVTRLVDGACIFLNRPGFAGGAGCALHVAALAAGDRPLDWKPQVCWQVPLRLEHSTDENGWVTSRLREWKRRDWGEGGNDFAWWCTEEPEAFVGGEPLVRSARDEIVALVGDAIYERLLLAIDELDAGAWVALPHPAVRR
jgi:hypothetical protein